MSTELTLHGPTPLPVAVRRAEVTADVRPPAPPAPEVHDPSTTYGPHDRVPLSDAEAEC